MTLDAAPFDLLCHLVFNAPLRTRRERAQQFREKVPPVSERGQVGDIFKVLGGTDKLCEAVTAMLNLLYAA